MEWPKLFGDFNLIEEHESTEIYLQFLNSSYLKVLKVGVEAATGGVL